MLEFDVKSSPLPDTQVAAAGLVKSLTTAAPGLCGTPSNISICTAPAALAARAMALCAAKSEDVPDLLNCPAVGSSVVFSLLADFGTRCSNITTGRNTLEADVLKYLVEQFTWDTGSYKAIVPAGNCTDVQVRTYKGGRGWGRRGARCGTDSLARHGLPLQQKHLETGGTACLIQYAT